MMLLLVLGDWEPKFLISVLSLGLPRPSLILDLTSMGIFFFNCYKAYNLRKLTSSVFLLKDIFKTGESKWCVRVCRVGTVIIVILLMKKLRHRGLINLPELSQLSIRTRIQIQASWLQSLCFLTSTLDDFSCGPFHLNLNNSRDGKLSQEILVLLLGNLFNWNVFLLFVGTSHRQLSKTVFCYLNKKVKRWVKNVE